MLTEIFRKIRFDRTADRIGPDVPFTHWRLYFSSTMQRLCRHKFRRFAQGAQFRPGAYAVGCSQIEIGSRVVVRPGSRFFGEAPNLDVSIIIEDDVMMGSGVSIYVNNHRFDRRDIPLIDQGHYPAKQVVLEQGCWVGANCILLPGVTIGRNAVVGAGSVVTRSIPPYCVAAGNPARVLKEIN